MGLGLAQAPQHYIAETMSVGSGTPDIKVLDGEDEANPWGEDGFTFGDVLDMINPLQQIPGVSTVYRAITGDEIAPAARLLGGSLLGGLPGLAMAAINTVVEETTGSDIGSTILAAFTGGAAEESVAAPTAIAAAGVPPAQSTSPAATPAPAQVAMAGPSTAPVTQNTSAGATSGSENAGAIQQPLQFFTPSSGQRVIYSRPQPGALTNNLFQPLTSPAKPEIASAAPAAVSAAPAPSSQPVPVSAKIAAANPATTAPEISQAAPAAAGAPTTAEAREAANRAAMLAFARDMKALAEGHAGYNANERLQKLAATHAKNTNTQQ